MVSRSLLGALAVSSGLLVGCDPFGPASPENPSNTRVATVAALPQDVSVDWGKALSSRDMLLVGDVTGDALRLVQAGDSLSNGAFLKCVQNDLFGSASDTSILVWQASYTQDAGASGADVVVAKIEYSITKPGAPKISGTAKWTISDVNTLGWELVRWEDLSESKSGLFAFCKAAL